MSEQQKWIATSFVDLATHLVDDFDLVDLLSTLAERCARFTGAAEVGFLIIDASGKLQVLGSSSEKMQALELFELQHDEGPCLDCFNNLEAVVNVDCSESRRRWPEFAERLETAGIKMAHAFPMRLRDEALGAMNLFHTEERTLDTNEQAVTQAFADAATIAIVQDRALRHATLVAELQHALDNRVTIEQAKGVLSERAQVEMSEAFELLRTYARSHNQRLSEVALDLIEGRIESDAFTKDPALD